MKVLKGTNGKNSLMSTLCVRHVSCISGLEPQPKMSLKDFYDHK